MSSAKLPFSGTGTGKPPVEKSKFLQTCNRLSQFMKEKGSLRDLSFGINAKSVNTGIPELASPAEIPTVDLLSNMNKLNKPGENSSKEEKQAPEYVILDSSCEIDDPTIKASSSKAAAKPKTAQMTIFYSGEIVVLDDVPADRARDLMLMAKNGPPNSKIENRNELASTSKSPSHDSGPQEQINLELQAKGSDLPIARRASLHKFLAKRKDRATVRAPYQLHNPSPGGSSSGNGEHSFDLNN